MTERIDALMRMTPVIPVLVIDEAETAKPIAEALVAGGISVLEVTLRTGAAYAAIEAMAQVPGCRVGVGTVVSPEQFSAAKDAGAQFAVTPGLHPVLLEAADECDLPLLPGVMTPSDIIAATLSGFDRLKFFPAGAAGGVAMLKSFAGPFPDVAFCPTGGVNADNLKDYQALDNVLCVGGSWLVPAEAVAQRDWDRIRSLAQAACQ